MPLATDENAAPGEENVVVAPAVDPFEEAVHGELEKLRTPKTSWMQTVGWISIRRLFARRTKVRPIDEMRTLFRYGS
jgi:hypothetical protein